MVAGLGDLLRYALDHAGRQRVRLGEEVEMITRYLEIHQARFPDRMTFAISVDATLEQAAVPILILQPLAENAVRHGVERSRAMTLIEVQARQLDDRLQLQVSSRGVLAAPLQEGIGLANTRERLRAMYGDAARFALMQRDDQVLAMVDLPFETAS